MKIDDCPRFTIRIVDHRRGEQIEVLLLETPFRSRCFALRLNGREPQKLHHATCTQVWDRLRKWMARRVRDDSQEGDRLCIASKIDDGTCQFKGKATAR